MKNKESLLIRFLLWLFKKRVMSYVAYRNWQIGFTGCGTTGLDKEPDFQKPWLPYPLRFELDKAAIDYAVAKWDCWRKAEVKVIGEDHGGWPGLPDSFISSLPYSVQLYYRRKKASVTINEFFRICQDEHLLDSLG